MSFPVNLIDLDGHPPVARFSSAIRRTFVQHFARFKPRRVVPLRDCTLFLVLCTVQVVFTLNMHKKEITNFLDKV